MSLLLACLTMTRKIMFVTFESCKHHIKWTLSNPNRWCLNVACQCFVVFSFMLCSSIPHWTLNWTCWHDVVFLEGFWNGRTNSNVFFLQMHIVNCCDIALWHDKSQKQHPKILTIRNPLTAKRFKMEIPLHLRCCVLFKFSCQRNAESWWPWNPQMLLQFATTKMVGLEQERSKKKNLTTATTRAC